MNLVIDSKQAISTRKRKTIIEIDHGKVSRIIIPEHYREYLELVPTNEVLRILENESLRDYVTETGDIIRMSNDVYEDLGTIITQSDLFLPPDIQDPYAFNWEYQVTKECLIGFTIV